VSGPSFEDWTFWYEYNKDDIENLKRKIYDIGGSGGAIFQGGGSDATSETGATRLTQTEVAKTVIPTLMWAMDPKNANHQDIRSAAYIALAKMATDPEHIKTIMSGLDKDRKLDQVVLESSALSLGLLRRADPRDQFTARDLDQVREFLFKVFQDDDYQPRTRGFAALAIGLLGDQPTGSGEYAADASAASRRTTQHLLELLKDKYSKEDLYVSLLVAIGLQPPISLTSEDRQELVDAAYKGRLYKERISGLVQSYAAHTLGRIGTKTEIKPLENILNARRGMDNRVQRSAAIGLGLLGRHVSGEDRVEVAKALLEAIDKSKDNSTTNFAIISIAYLLNEDIHSQTTDVMGNTRADETLLEIARKGKYLEKPYGALALGLVAREIKDDLMIEDYQKFKQAAIETIRNGMVETNDKKGTAAFCVAAGIAQDHGSRKQLLTFVNDDRGDKMLRGYAALSLGLIGVADGEVVKAISEALRERSSEELRRQAAVGLGLLGNVKIPGTGQSAVELLVSELKEAKTQNHKGQIVLALASIGDHSAIPPLVGLLKDKSEQFLTRALSCAGLGLIGDLEWTPSLSLISKNVNYRSSVDVMNEVLSIL
jgi:HEAT repeat protein